MLFKLSNSLKMRAMGKHITDKDRFATLQILFSREEKHLPFSKQKLDYLKPLSHRLNQLSNSGRVSGDHSLIMLRQMIDELLIEITAQVNWTVGETRTGKNKKVLNQFRLIPWNQSDEILPQTQVKVA